MSSPHPSFWSSAFEDIPAPDFADVQIVTMPGGSTSNPKEWARVIFSVRAAPWPVRLLLGLRQLLAPLIGVARAESDVFAIADIVGDEALIGSDADHLDFRVGVGVDGQARLVRVTTTVRLHGWRGRVYFLPVRLLHGPVLQSMMNRAAKRLASRE